MTKEERKADARAAYNALMKFYPFTLDDLDGEEWQPISGYEDRYHISNFGRVKSFWHSKSKILKPEFDKDGYLRVDLRLNGKHKHFFAHKLAAMAFIPNTGSKPQINHLDGCKFNNHVSNLEWCTQAENNQHALDTGLRTILQGEDCSWAKLTNEQVRQIRDNSNGLSCKELGKIFGVDRRIIGDVQRGMYYRDVGGKIRKSNYKKTPEEICTAIRAEYKKGVNGCGKRALAKKFGLGITTIHSIIHEQD